MTWKQRGLLKLLLKKEKNLTVLKSKGLLKKIVKFFRKLGWIIYKKNLPAYLPGGSYKLLIISITDSVNPTEFQHPDVTFFEIQQMSAFR